MISKPFEILEARQLLDSSNAAENTQNCECSFGPVSLGLMSAASSFFLTALSLMVVEGVAKHVGTLPAVAAAGIALAGTIVVDAFIIPSANISYEDCSIHPPEDYVPCPSFWDQVEYAAIGSAVVVVPAWAIVGGVHLVKNGYLPFFRGAAASYESIA